MNTNSLKKIESLVKAEFLKQLGATSLNNKIPNVEPDVLAHKDKTLIIGEITTSGFIGAFDPNKNHVGAARKLGDTYAKLDYLRRKKNYLKDYLQIDFENIEIYYITIKGSKFNPKGWRKNLLEECDMKHIEIQLKNEEVKLINDCLVKSSNEIKNVINIKT